MTESPVSPSPAAPRGLGPLRRRGAYLATVALLILGAAGSSAYLIATRPGPSGELIEPPRRLVRVCRAEKVSHRLAITVYGTSRSSRQWAAIAEVRGRAAAVDPRFEAGELLPAGTLLVAIDKTDYDLAVERLDAEVRAQRQQLQQTFQTEANLREVFDLQERQRELADAEHQRQRALFDRGTISRAALEVAENAMVAAMTAVQQTRNSLDLLPVERALLEASIDSAEAQLRQARRDVEKCEIRLPMAARCASKSVEQDQFVAAGERLGTFIGLDMAEVVAMVEPRKMLSLFPGGIEELGELGLSTMDLDRSLVRRMRVPAEVRWGLSGFESVWHGRVARIGALLDPGTRTVPVIVEVPEPYENIRPGVRPPLVPDAFCKVIIYGATVEGVVLVPREALRDDRAYVVREGRLHVAPVEVLALEEDRAVVRRGIEPGDLVVLSDVFVPGGVEAMPAGEGMPLETLVVPNPVEPRTEIAVPPSVFDFPVEDP